MMMWLPTWRCWAGTNLSLRKRVTGHSMWLATISVTSLSCTAASAAAHQVLPTPHSNFTNPKV